MCLVGSKHWLEMWDGKKEITQGWWGKPQTYEPMLPTFFFYCPCLRLLRRQTFMLLGLVQLVIIISSIIFNIFDQHISVIKRKVIARKSLKIEVI